MQRAMLSTAALIAAVLCTAAATRHGHPAAKKYADGSVLQSAGPVGITRGDTAHFGVLLPAVQRIDTGAQATLRLIYFPGGQTLLERSVALRSGGP